MAKQKEKGTTIRSEGVVRKLAAYMDLGNDAKTGGVKDISVLHVDSLTGIKESIATAFPKTEDHRCIVHQERNMLKYSSHENRNNPAKYLKTADHAPNGKTDCEKGFGTKKKNYN